MPRALLSWHFLPPGTRSLPERLHPAALPCPRQGLAESPPSHACSRLLTLVPGKQQRRAAASRHPTALGILPGQPGLRRVEGWAPAWLQRGEGGAEGREGAAALRWCCGCLQAPAGHSRDGWAEENQPLRLVCFPWSWEANDRLEGNWRRSRSQSWSGWMDRKGAERWEAGPPGRRAARDGAAASPPHVKKRRGLCRTTLLSKPELSQELLPGLTLHVGTVLPFVAP